MLALLRKKQVVILLRKIGMRHEEGKHILKLRGQGVSAYAS